VIHICGYNNKGMFQGKPSNPETQIFIGDLPGSVIESELYTQASKYGEVVYIRILRHFQTKESLGIAFVSFAKVEQAQLARSSLNGINYKGNYIRVARFCKDRDPEANLYISDLPESLTARELEEHLLRFGPIVSSKVSFDKNLKSNRYGYVQFERKADAAKVLEATIEISGQKIQASKFLPASQRESLHNKNNLYVRGFDSSFKSEQFVDVFKTFGEIQSHQMMSVKDFKGNLRYFAYVSFKNPEDAQKAMDSLNDKNVSGVTWTVVVHQNRAVRKAKLALEYRKKVEDWKRKNLFIKGFPKSLNEVQLKEICSEYGSIVSVKIIKLENIQYQDSRPVQTLISKGCGFVCFGSYESASAAFTGLKNKKIEGETLSVFFWKPREELVRELNANKIKKMQVQMMQYGMMYPPVMGRGAFRGKPVRSVPSVNQISPMVMAPKPPEVKLNFDINAFWESSPEIQKRILGENMYPIVLEKSNQRVAGKITGMLLEIPPETLIKMLHTPGEIANKVREAVEVLRKAWKDNPENLSLLADI
jgi:polyadenylate-binding protein